MIKIFDAVNANQRMQINPLKHGRFSRPIRHGLGAFSEMNSTHPFYPVLIPNTPYVKFSFLFILFLGGSKGVQNIFLKLMLPKNYFNYGL